MGQIEGYTVLLQPEAGTDHALGANEGDVPVAALSQTDAVDDVHMKDSTDGCDTLETRPQGQLDDATQGDVQMVDDTSTTDKDAVRTRPGFRRYICVEHVDSLT